MTGVMSYLKKQGISFLENASLVYKQLLVREIISPQMNMNWQPRKSVNHCQYLKIESLMDGQSQSCFHIG